MKQKSLKTGSLFTAPCLSSRAFQKELKELNAILRPKGLCAIPLRFRKGRALVYIYRRSALAGDPGGQGEVLSCTRPKHNAAAKLTANCD